MWATSSQHRVVFFRRIVLLVLLLASSPRQQIQAFTVELDPDSPVTTTFTSRSTTAFVQEDALLQDAPTVTVSRFDDALANLEYAQTGATVRTLSDGTQQVEWKGVLLTKGAGFATVIQQGNGDLSAHFGTEQGTYALSKKDTAATDHSYYVLTQTFWNGAPQESNLDDRDDNMEDESAARMRYRTSQAQQETSNKIVQIETSTALPNTVRTITVQTASTGITAIQGPSRRLRGQPQTRQLTDNLLTIDLLVVVTRDALCESNDWPEGLICPVNDSTRGVMEGKLAVALAETNNALSETGVPAQIRIVRVDYLEATETKQPATKDALDYLRFDPVITQARSDTGADLISMICTGGNGSQNGIAYLDHWVSAISWKMFPYYTFSHELFHNLAADHNREASTQDHPYSHGLLLPEYKMRTVMSYSCLDGVNCPRIPYLSAKGYYYTDNDNNDIAIGDDAHDNARAVREHIQQAANYMEPKVSDGVVILEPNVDTDNNDNNNTDTDTTTDHGTTTDSNINSSSGGFWQDLLAGMATPFTFLLRLLQQLLLSRSS